MEDNMAMMELLERTAKRREDRRQFLRAAGTATL